MLRGLWEEIFNKDLAEQERIARELCENFRMEHDIMKGIELEGYRKGFNDGVSVSHKYPQKLIIMGYSFEQIIELICKNEKEEGIEMADTLPLTKSAAHKLIFTTFTKLEVKEVDCLLNILENMGITKFKPEPAKQLLSMSILNWQDEYGTVNIQDTPEGLEVWVGGQFRYRRNRK